MFYHIWNNKYLAGNIISLLGEDSFPLLKKLLLSVEALLLHLINQPNYVRHCGVVYT